MQCPECRTFCHTRSRKSINDPGPDAWFFCPKCDWEADRVDENGKLLPKTMKPKRGYRDMNRPDPGTVLKLANEKYAHPCCKWMAEHAQHITGESFGVDESYSETFTLYHDDIRSVVITNCLGCGFSLYIASPPKMDDGTPNDETFLLAAYGTNLRDKDGVSKDDRVGTIEVKGKDTIRNLREGHYSICPEMDKEGNLKYFKLSWNGNASKESRDDLVIDPTITTVKDAISYLVGEAFYMGARGENGWNTYSKRILGICHYLTGFKRDNVTFEDLLGKHKRINEMLSKKESDK